MTNQFDNSKKMYNQAKKYIAGGISSQIRKNDPAKIPLFFSHAKGSKMWDVDGNEYIDYIQGMGPNLFGHSPDFISELVKKEMDRGYVFAAQFEKEIEIAKMALELIPIKNATARFAISGTEIDQLLFRVMRGYTKKNKIVKFEGHYHGWMDSVNYSVHPSLSIAGDENNPNPIPESTGMDLNTRKSLIICEWNDEEKIEKVFNEFGDDIAGVITEPILANTNCILPKKGYLEKVKSLCEKHNALLAFDEVITGFRVAAGGAQELLKITPHIATYAKSMAGGFPMSMIVGEKQIMNEIGNGNVYHGGSFNSNVMSTAATYATLKYLQDSKTTFYENLNKKGEFMIENLKSVSKSQESDMHVQGIGSLLSISFTNKEEIINWRDHAKNCNEEKYSIFAYEMLKNGIRLSSNGRMHISSAHTHEDLEKTISAVEKVLSKL
ncbi:MAG: hypothetical protein CL748_00395 [Chloroflexi bacterium]|nr:hypothetical protein [Chloroflexota bacterium]